MCGRFTLQSTEAVYKRFQVSNRLDSPVPRCHIAPGQMVPVSGRGGPCPSSIGPAAPTRAPRRRADAAAGVHPRQTRQRGSSAEPHWPNGRGMAR
jgi:putative SOS response-associated peptidase YedK